MPKFKTYKNRDKEHEFIEQTFERVATPVRGPSPLSKNRGGRKYYKYPKWDSDFFDSNVKKAKQKKKKK